MKRGANILLVVAVVGLGLWYFMKHASELNEALAIGPAGLAGLVGLNLISRCLAGIRLKLLTSALDVKIGLGKAIRLSFMQAYINGVLLKGGTAAIAYYFKRVHDLKVEKFLGLLAAATVLSIVTSCAVLLAVMLFMQKEGSELIIVVSLGLLVVGILALVLPKRDWFLTSRFNILSRVIEGASIFRGRPKLFFMALIIELAALAVMAFRLGIAFMSFSEPTTLLTCFVYSPVSVVSSLLSFTPQGLGLKEALVGYASVVLGVSFDTGVFASTFDRAVQVVVSLTFGLPATAGFLRRKEDTETT